MFQVLACGAAIVTLSMGVRHGFGLWLQPITQAQAGPASRSPLRLPSKPVVGRDRHLCRHGGRPVWRLPRADRAVPCWPTAWGLAGWRFRHPASLFALTTGLLDRAAQAGTTYAVIYGVLGGRSRPRGARGPWAWPRRQARSASS